MKRKRIFIYSTILLVLILGLLSCAMFRINHQQMERKVAKINNSEVVFIKLKSGKIIRTVITNKSDVQKPVLVFVHGAPGDSRAFLDYHRDSLLQQKYRVLSYDRPGYGFKDGYSSLTSIVQQSNVLNEVMDSLQIDSTVLFAHSYGGAIALECAITHPEKVKAMVLAAVAVDPENEKYFWFGKFGKWEMTKWALPKQIRVSGDEKYSHEEELRKLDKKLGKVSQHTFVFHSKDDFLVPFENLNYLKEKLNNANLEINALDKGNHFLVWKNMELFKELLLQL